MARSVLVTGGTSGIGLAIAKRFFADGAEVTVTGRSQEEVEGVASEFKGIVLDLSCTEQIEGVASRFPRLDVLVNCAGIILRDQAEHSLEGFEQVLRVNLTAAMAMCTALKPSLQICGGSVVNIASMLSYFGSGHVPAYSASKGGIVQLTKSLAIAWAPDGIRVNAVAPGWIETALTEPLQNDPTRSREILARTPMGRWGHPSDIAGPVVFLCSDDARFITGSVLPVDGGYSVM